MPLVEEMILSYSLRKDKPKAYSMDIAIIKHRGTALLEIHHFVSLGLYTYLLGSSLPYCYKEGIDWYINQNSKLEI